MMDSPTLNALPAYEQSQITSPHVPPHARSAVQLSDDIICQIYYILANDYPPWPPIRTQVPTRYHRGRPGRLGWIQLTHVCRSWRRVGLGMSTLWAAIVRDFPPDVLEIAERARDTPLTMILNQHDDNRMHWTINDIAKVITRARTYADVTAHRGQSWNAFLAGRNLPLLHHLVLYTDISDRYDIPGASNTNSLDAPALHVLQTNFPRPILAPALTALSLHEGFWRRKGCLKFINRFPSLEQLHLPVIRGDHEHEGPDPESDESDDETTPNALLEEESEPGSIQLPHLKLLALGYFDDNANDLLRHLEYPQDVELQVERFDKDVMKTLMSRSDWDYAPHDALIIEDSYLQYACQFGVQVIFSETRPEPNMRTQSIVDGLFPCGVPETLDAMPDSALSKIQTFGFSHNCPCPTQWAGCRGTMGGVDATLLTKSLVRFTSVHKVLIHNQDDATPIFTALRAADPSAQLAFPALETLIVFMKNEVGVAWWRELRTILAERKAAGHAINRLVIRGKGTFYADCPCHYEFSKERRKAREDQSDDEGLVKVDRLQEQGAKEEDIHAACREYRRITLDRERQLVGEVNDERGELGTYKSDCIGP